MRNLICTFVLINLSITCYIYAETIPQKAEIISVMQLVNDYWIAGHSGGGDNGWARATYFTGNMAMYNVYPDDRYKNYALQWAENHNWQPGPLARDADDFCCGQTYIDLFMLDPDSTRIEPIKERIEAMTNSTQKDDWWWIDALYMAMPVFTRLGVIYNKPSYLTKMYDLYSDTKYRRALYDSTDGLWYRDENYSSPEDTTIHGKKIYWSRGNGWVFGGHVRTLQFLPEDDPHRTEYRDTFIKMAAALKKTQHADGLWGVNLADSLDFPGPETSGTGFFTYGLAWGINNGLLDSTDYYNVVAKAWNGLVQTAVHSDGFLGYVQAPGEQPASAQPVTYNSTADYGVGAFLLAGSEVFKLAQGEAPDSTKQREDLALNKVIRYSSQEEDPYNPASNAVDGDLNTRWSALNYPQWIELDLGKLKKSMELKLPPMKTERTNSLLKPP